MTSTHQNSQDDRPVRFRASLRKFFKQLDWNLFNDEGSSEQTGKLSPEHITLLLKHSISTVNIVRHMFYIYMDYNKYRCNKDLNLCKIVAPIEDYFDIPVAPENPGFFKISYIETIISNHRKTEHDVTQKVLINSPEIKRQLVADQLVLAATAKRCLPAEPVPPKDRDITITVSSADLAKLLTIAPTIKLNVKT